MQAFRRLAFFIQNLFILSKIGRHLMMFVNKRATFQDLFGGLAGKFLKIQME